jgi:hypothetical protein
VFFSLQNFFSCYKTQQLILGTGIAIWWLTEPHWNKSVALFCCQVAALVPDMLRYFYFVKIHKIAFNSTISEVGE